MPPPPPALPLLMLVVTQHQEHLGQSVQNTGTGTGAQPEAWRTPVKASAPATRDERVLAPSGWRGKRGVLTRSFNISNFPVASQSTSRTVFFLSGDPSRETSQLSSIYTHSFPSFHHLSASSIKGKLTTPSIFTFSLSPLTLPPILPPALTPCR